MRVGRVPLLVALVLASGIAAPTPNPSLSALVEGIDEEAGRRELPVTDLAVDVHIVGAIARATVQMRFMNVSGEVLEGRLMLALPEAATVTGYALDVEGRFIEGVLAPPARARIAYEERVRDGIDPGLAQVSRGNVFSSRVFPIDEERGRGIRVSFVAPVHPQAGWSLPLETDGSVGRLRITVRAEGLGKAPALVLPAQLTAQWSQEGDIFTASATASKRKLTGELRFAPVSSAQPLLTSRHSSGRLFFQLLDTVPADSMPRPAPARVRLYWDRSRSRRDDALGREIELIGRYLQTAQPGAIDVVTFNSSGARVESLQNAAQVQRSLRRVTYRGGTSFSVLKAVKLPEATMCLLFSDGIGTIDRLDTFEPDCELSAVTSAPDADVGYLARLMGTATSLVLRLDRRSTDEALERLKFRVPTIVDVRDASGATLPFSTLPAQRGGLAAVGEMPVSGEIVVRIGGSGSQIEARRYAARQPTKAFEGAGALWAAEQVALLAALERRAELRRVSRRFHVASPHMAFVVLESPWDYVRAGIVPPRGFPKEWRDEYRKEKAEHDEEQRSAREMHLEAVLERWEQQKEWWATAFDPSAAAPPPEPEATGEELEEIITTGARSSELVALVELAPWDARRPYLRALEAASATQLDRVLAEQDELHGELPAFYFDVAEWFHRRGQRSHAVEWLLAALEIPSRNDETTIVVADRLLRYGQVNRAIWLCAQLVELAPHRPQPRRALALAFAERAKRGGAEAKRDLTHAVKLLNEVITTPWQGAYEGIELIALMEANTLLAKLKALGESGSFLDPRLVAPLDVDLRVVIEWNTEASDMDLWVEEPNGDQASYRRPSTAIGGRLSNDMTHGFGPEEYLLRQAPEGRFHVEANVFEGDRLNPNGATVVTARLTRDFGRPGEHTETIDLELGPEDVGGVPIGAFVLSKSEPGLAVIAAPKE